MNTEQLYAFKASYELQSFTRAAEQQFKSQSAVTQLIRSLETELNTALFLRHVRPIRPTEAGSRFYPYAVRMLKDYEESLTICGEEPDRRFQFHYMATFAGIMDQFLASVPAEQSPEIVKIAMSDFTQTISWKPGTLYLVREDILFSRQIVRRFAYESSIYAELPDRTALAGKASLSLDDLTDTLIVLPPPGSSTPLTRRIRRQLTEDGRFRIKSIEGVEVGLMYAITNNGVCFCTSEFLRPRDHIRYIPVPELGVLRYYFAALTEFTPEMKQFMKRFECYRQSAEYTVTAQ